MVQEVLNTKIKVYRATVLITLLYGAETWTCYRRHVKMLDAFHMRHLIYLMDIKWQDKITNNEVLQRAKIDGIKAMLMRAQLKWVGHVQRMSGEKDDRYRHRNLARVSRKHNRLEASGKEKNTVL